MRNKQNNNRSKDKKDDRYRQRQIIHINVHNSRTDKKREEKRQKLTAEE